MGEVIDLAAKRAEKAAKEPETLTPDGIAVEAGLTPDGQGVVWVLLLKAGETEDSPPIVTHRIGMYAGLGYQAAQLLANSSAQIEVQADQFRRQHARRLANEQRQARGHGLILPSYVNQDESDDAKPIA